MSDISLLPPNATPLERRLTVANAGMVDIDLPQRRIWNIDDCPAELLPHLAWTFSVDRWDPNWSEATKRAVIKASAAIHKRKGTIGAIRRVVEPLGYLIKVVEWWQMNPRAPRGTFQLEVGVLDTGITDEMFIELERLIADAQRKSQHLTGLAISLETRGQIPFAVAATDGDELTVYPYLPETITVGGTSYAGGVVHDINTMSIYP